MSENDGFFTQLVGGIISIIVALIGTIIVSKLLVKFVDWRLRRPNAPQNLDLT